MSTRFRTERIERVLGAVRELRDAMVARAREEAPRMAEIREASRPSAFNLLHYLALRDRDLRELQPELAQLGLSSLGRCEAHALASVDAVLAALHHIANLPMPQSPEAQPPVDHSSGRRRLEQNSVELLGRPPAGRGARIMVTLPTAAATEPSLAKRLVTAGMDVARINSAHDSAEQWRAMVHHVRQAAKGADRSVKILLDLAGPKLRTTSLAPGSAQHLRLEVGDELLLNMDEQPGLDAKRAASGRVIEPARIGCTIGRALGRAHPGHSIWFDDGKIGGEVVSVAESHVRIRIVRARPGGCKLREGKGINLPDTDLGLEHATAQDLAALDTMVEHIDALGLSFVERPGDVEHIIRLLRDRDADDRGLVLKVETQRAFQSLPELLLAGMKSPPLGVMVARGDLAVEVGFARMAEVQEEILWLCEAAHVPVIWATQVLESLAKTGTPSRAEVSDAALAVRAECVMLNKGPHIISAVSFLDDVLRRMQRHQQKKSSMLRRLSLAGE